MHISHEQQLLSCFGVETIFYSVNCKEVSDGLLRSFHIFESLLKGYSTILMARLLLKTIGLDVHFKSF